MHILVVGLNHRTAPVDIREKLTFQDHERAEALDRLRNTKSILESVIISTCNRTEIYVVADQLHTGRYYVKNFLAEWFGIEMPSFSSYLFFKENDGAVEHLFRVTSGLDSMVLGETQILGQVREAFTVAQEVQAVGTIFKELFKQAITIAKRAHSEVMINENAVSISYAAVELARKIFDELKHKRILVVGAGKMSELTAKHLYSQGVDQITVMNRTHERAIDLAKRFSAEAKTLDQLHESLTEVDILISSTGAKDYIVTKELMSQIVKERKGKPLFIVDIAVPRDIDPIINDMDGIFLYDIDDLEGVVEANLAEREEDARTVELMLEEGLVAFKQWVETLGVVPVISALRQKALSIQQETLDSILRKIPDLSEREKKVISKHTKSIVNQLLKDPILHAKELAGQSDSAKSLENFIRIFNIQDELEKQKQSQLPKKTSVNDKQHGSLPLTEAPLHS